MLLSKGFLYSLITITVPDHTPPSITISGRVIAESNVVTANITADISGHFLYLSANIVPVAAAGQPAATSTTMNTVSGIKSNHLNISQKSTGHNISLRNVAR